MFNKKQSLIAIEQKIDHLTGLLEGDELNKLKHDSEELKEIKELLSHVKLKIKDVRVVNDSSIVVNYDAPRVVIQLDDEGKPIKDEFFYATNMLNLISYEDMSKFSEILRKAKKK